MGDLKPCPFCGGDAALIECSDHSTAYVTTHNSDGCAIDGHWDWHVTKLDAVKSWNTRFSDTSMQVE